jgi:hypothetical protein
MYNNHWLELPRSKMYSYKIEITGAINTHMILRPLYVLQAVSFVYCRKMWDASAWREEKWLSHNEADIPARFVCPTRPHLLCLDRSYLEPQLMHRFCLMFQSKQLSLLFVCLWEANKWGHRDNTLFGDCWGNFCSWWVGQLPWSM